jgi:hypothetical protein
LLPKVSQVSLTAAKVRHTKHQAKRYDTVYYFETVYRFTSLTKKNMQKKIDKITRMKGMKKNVGFSF